MIHESISSCFGRPALRVLKHFPWRITVSSAVLALIPLMTMPGNVSGQDSLCVHFDSRTPNARVELKRRHSLNAILPATLCDLRKGESWKIMVDGLGLERRTGELALGTDGMPSVRGNRTSAMMWNLLIPGRGAVRQGRRVSGWSDLGTVLATGYYYGVEQLEYMDMKEKHDELLERRESASTYEELVSVNDALHYSSKALNVQNSHRKRALILFSASYAGQLLLEPLLFGGPPSWSVDAGGSIVNLEAGSRTRAKAFLYSLVWPGKGQFYQGKSTRGFLMTGLATAAGIYALDRMNAYDETAFRYEIDVDKWRDSSSPEEKEYLQSRASELWSELDEIKTERNVALIILGSVWGLGLLDTFFPLDEFVPSAGGLSVQAGPTGMTIALDF